MQMIWARFILMKALTSGFVLNSSSLLDSRILNIPVTIEALNKAKIVIFQLTLSENFYFGIVRQVAGV